MGNVSIKKESLVFKNLGGYFKWFVMGNGTTLVDPKHLEEYQLSQLPEYQLSQLYK